MTRTAVTIATILLLMSMPNPARTAEKMFPKTRVGVVEIKTIPAATLLIATSEGSYFSNTNNLFMRLFGYIKEHDISMTAPVEGHFDVEHESMRFYVGPEDARKALTNDVSVEVAQFPERRVASLGARGSYRRKNVYTTRAKLLDWLDKNDQYEAVGPVYGVFWDPPFIPWFLRRYEVHVPVEARDFQ